jgi:hypothetical protein
MNRFFYTLAFLLGLLVLAPAFAMAQTTASTTPRKTPEVKLEARLERAKQKASQEITRRTDALTRLEERIAAMKRVSATFKTDLNATVAAEIAKLEALAAKIAASTNGEEIKADVQSITRSYRIFALVMPKAAIAAAADRIVTMSATLSEVGGKLKARIDAASSQGKDVTALNTMLNDLAAKITSANAHAKAAVDGTATLTPDEGDKTKQEANKAALQKAREELKAGHDDIKAGREIIRKIMDGLKTSTSTVSISASV